MQKQSPESIIDGLSPVRYCIDGPDSPYGTKMWLTVRMVFVKDTRASALSIIQVMLVCKHTSMRWCHTFFNENQTKVERRATVSSNVCNRPPAVRSRCTVASDRKVRSHCTHGLERARTRSRQAYMSAMPCVYYAGHS